MSKLKITYRPTASLVPYARNSRTHSQEQVAQIAASIREFGFTNPILLGEDQTVIAGHGRLLAAQMLKLESVPTITLAGLTEAQRRALVIADNKIAQNAGWDVDLLKIELNDLQVAEFDMSLIGFTPQELTNLMGLEEKLGEPKDDEGDNYAEQYGVIVVCKDSAHQENVYNDLMGRGYTCKVVNT